MPITGEIQLNPQAFHAAVAWAAKWVAAKPMQPTAGGLLLTVDGEGLSIGAYDENVTGRALVPLEGMDLGAQDVQSRAVVSGRLLAELAGTFGNKPVSISGDDKVVYLRSGRFTASLPMMDADDFPALAEVAPPIGTVIGSALADAAARTAVAVGHDPTLGMVFCVVHAEFEEKAITLLATDRYRAAGVVLPWSVGDGGANREALVLGSVMRTAAAGFSGPDEITIGLTGSSISLTSPTRSLVVQQSELPGDKSRPGEYPVAQFQSYMTAQHSASVLLTPSELLVPLKRAAMVREKDGPIRLTFTPGTLAIAAAGTTTSQKGDEELDVDYDGPEVSMAFNPAYLSEALASVPGDTVRLGFTDPRKQVTLTVDDNPNWHHILMPLRK